jgi:hypothetical protein
MELVPGETPGYPVDAVTGEPLELTQEQHDELATKLINGYTEGMAEALGDEVLSPYEEVESEDAIFDEQPDVIRFTHSDGEQTLDYVHIDVVNSIRQALQRKSFADLGVIFEAVDKRQAALAQQ